MQVKAHADSVDVHEAENAKSLELSALKVNTTKMLTLSGPKIGSFVAAF